MATRFEYNLTTGEVKEVPLTQEEIDAALAAKAAEDEYNSLDNVAERTIRAAFEESKIARLMFEIEYDQESRLRTLEGRQAISKSSYRNALLNAYKELPE